MRKVFDINFIQKSLCAKITTKLTCILLNFFILLFSPILFTSCTQNQNKILQPKMLQKTVYSVLNNLENEKLKEEFSIPPQTKNMFCKKGDTGIAVRLINKNKDRGCLALYTGLNLDSREQLEYAVRYCTFCACSDKRYTPVKKDEVKDLLVNVCIFSEWQKIEDPMDFDLTCDSLIVENKNAQNQDDYRTLLQSAIAKERNYSKEDFLNALCRKAHLKQGSYTDKALVFYKSRTKTIYFSENRFKKSFVRSF